MLPRLYQILQNKVSGDKVLMVADAVRTTLIQEGWLDHFAVWSTSENKELRYYTASALANLIENGKIAERKSDKVVPSSFSSHIYAFSCTIRLTCTVDAAAILVVRRFGMDIFVSIADVTDIDVKNAVEKAMLTLKRRTKEQGKMNVALIQ